MDNKTSDEYVRDGVIALSRNDLENANFYLSLAIKADEHNVDAYYNLGAVQLYMGKPELAVDSYKKALELAPSDYEVLYNLGTVYIGLKRYQEASDAFEKSLEINPYYENSLNNLGVSYNNLGRLSESIAILKKSIDINAENASTYNNIGVAYSKSGLPAQAVDYFRRAIDLKPDYASALNNLGNALQQIGLYDDAEDCYLRAIDLEKSYPEALINIAANYHEKRGLKSALDYYYQAQKLVPNNSTVSYHLLHILMQACDWKNAKLELKKLYKIGGKEDPLMNIMHSDDLKDNLDKAVTWSEDVKGRTRDYTFNYHAREGNKIKVGYVNNFQEKPVGLLTKDLYSLHDRRKFEVYAYSYGAAPGANLREKVAYDSDHFVDIADMPNLDAAKLINENKIDILVDLKGYTKGGRPEIFAYKPASIQISYLGFPGTIGADFFDYVITDKTLTSKAMQKYFTEKFLYMPDCYQIVSGLDITPKTLKRSSYGLPEDKVVYSCLNQTLKIDEKMFQVWLKILKKTDSVLWLHRSNDLAEENIRLYALNNNFDPDRIIFSDTVSFEEHVNRLSLSDIVLDTRIYNGGATTSITLKAGVPVITMTGKHYLSRMGTSLLQAVKMPQLVTTNLKDYEKLAVSLGNDAKKLSEVKIKLAKNVKTSPLFDTKLFVRNLEKNYIKIVNGKSKSK